MRRDRLLVGWLSWRRKRFWAWVLLATYAFIGAVVAPWLLRGQLVAALEKELPVAARLADVTVNPFALSIRLTGFALDDRAVSALVKVEDAFVNLSLASLWRWAWTFDEVRLTNPFVRVERRPDGRLNLSALVPSPAAEDPSPTERAALPRLFVDRFVLTGGRAEVEDAAAARPLATTLGPIDVTVNDLTTLPAESGQQEVSIVTEGGGRITWSGSVDVDPLRSKGRAELSGIPLPKLSAYVPAAWSLAVTDGSLAMGFDYTFDVGADGVAMSVANLALTVAGLQVTDIAPDAAQPLFGFAELGISGGQFAWPQRTATVDRVVLSAPTVALVRESDGQFVWDRLTPAQASAPPPAPAVATNTASEWDVRVGQFEVVDGAATFDDRALPGGASFGASKVNLTVASFSLADGATLPLTFACTVDGGGEITLNGTLALRPAIGLDAKLGISGLALAQAQPYLATLSQASIAAGTLDVQGTLGSAPHEALSFAGRAQIDGLGIDGNGERLLGWQRLSLDGIAVALDAAHAEVSSVELDGLSSRVHVAKDRTVNLAVALAPPPGGAADEPRSEAATAVPGQPWAVKVGRVQLKNGATDYSDDSLPIPFAIKVHSLRGGAGAFDTTSRAVTRIRLDGDVGEYGVAHVDGALAPLDPTRDTTVDASFKNISMPSASPYSVRFAGHRIASGKLDLTMRYRVENARLEGDHDIVLRDFALGEAVDYPDAYNLPYGLVISLLKGPDGNISVQLPIEGDVDDPSFRLGGVIVKALFGLLTKLATSPFHLLGSLLGLGDSAQLDQVSFVPGSAVLAPPEREKIAQLASALSQRPGLDLDVPGVVAPEADALSLRQLAVDTRVETMVAGGNQESRRKVLESLYQTALPNNPLATIAATFTQPDAAGKPQFDELAYLNELQTRLVAVEPLPEDALPTLAAARSSAVHDGVLAAAEIAPERVAIAANVDVEPNQDGEIVMTLSLGSAGAGPSSP